MIEDVLDQISDKLGPFLTEFVSQKLYNKKRYSVRYKAIAVNLLLACGKVGYNFIRQMLPLPCLNTVRTAMNNLQRQPGIHTSLLKLVKMKYNLKTKQEKLCVILIDEMSLKKGFTYDQHTGSFVGLEDDGHVRTKRPATLALAIMAVGIIKKWRTPLGFIYVEKSASYLKIIEVIKETISAIEKEDLIVLGITADQGPNMERAFRVMGSKVDDPKVSINGKSYFTFKDPPHLIKSARNFLHKEPVKMPGCSSSAKWSHLIHLYNIDSKISVKYSPRLGRKHLYDIKFQNRMRVKYAAQILSHSSWSSLNQLVSKNKISANALATSEYCAKFNDIFDFFNSGVQKSKVPMKCAMRTDKPLPILKYVQFLKDLNTLNKRRQVKFINGWLHNINVIIELKAYLESLGVKYLRTRNLCQDPIENLFGRIRFKQKVPNAHQFSIFYANVAGSTLLRPPAATNCQDDTDYDVNALENLLNEVSLSF